MSASEERSDDRIEIDWLRAVAGALAAVVSAVLLSTLGEVGTLLGAALGSLTFTIGSALFAQGIRSSRRTLAKAQTNAKQKVGIAKADVHLAERTDDARAADGQPDHAEERLAGAHEEPNEAELAEAPLSWRQRFARLRWRQILVVSLGLFLAALAVITVFELLAGRSVASYTGGSDSDNGTTIGHVTNDSPKRSPNPEPSESPTPAASAPAAPAGSPTVASQTPTPFAGPSGSVSPSQTVTPSRTVTPSQTATPSETVTPSQSVIPSVTPSLEPAPASP